MIPYVPTCEASNSSTHVLVGKFTKAYCNVLLGKEQSQKYLIAVKSFLAFAQQLMGKNKDNIYLGISKDKKLRINVGYKKVSSQFMDGRAGNSPRKN